MSILLDIAYEIDELYKGNYYVEDCGTDSPYAKFDDEFIAKHLEGLLKEYREALLNVVLTRS